MTGHVPNLRHQCETDGCYRNELWDWTPFNDCFGNTGIRISDVDGIVERNSQMLMLDGKRIGKGGSRNISTGQRLLYKAFADRGQHVLVFHGHPPATVLFVRRWLPGGRFVQEEPCDLDGLKAIVSAWFQWAEGMRYDRLPVAEEIHVADPPRDPGEWPDVDTARPPDYVPRARPA